MTAQSETRGIGGDAVSLFILSQPAGWGDGPWRHSPHFLPVFLLFPLLWMFVFGVAITWVARQARPR